LTDTNLVFDIGANTGQDTAALLSRGLRAVAIEANPKLCADLRARLLAESRLAGSRRQPIA
jgi:FkbM family methyltransferase